MTGAPDLLLLRDLAARFLSLFIEPTMASQRLANTLRLRPREEDYARVFTDVALPIARANYSRLWSNVPPIQGKPTHRVVLAWVAASDALGGPDGARFPGGYQTILDRLQPNIPWVSWKFVAPGQVHGMAYDGLVRLDDRWVWFPKPWKLVTASVGGLDYMTD